MEITDEPFLIAHKVRGLPAFDIAIRLKIGEEEAWIIPTSGHRAFPYWSVKVSDLAHYDQYKGYVGFWHDLDHPCKYPPENWPDHYPAQASKPQQQIEEINLEELDL